MLDDIPIPVGYDFGVVDRERLDWLRRRLTPQPKRTVTDKIALSCISTVAERWYVECCDAPGDPPLVAIRAIAARLRGDPAWRSTGLDASHDCMISHSEETAGLLIAIASGSGPIEPSQGCQPPRTSLAIAEGR